jgi:hypothetical protein
MAAWPRAEWRSLLVALAISLAAHLLLLTTARPHRQGDGRVPVLVVTLTRAVAVPPPPAPAAVQAAATAPQPPHPPHPRPAPSPQAATAPAAAAARAPALPAVPPQPAVTQPQPAPKPADETPAATDADAPEQPATPVSSPELGDVARRVVGRRLQATVWIDENGTVRQAAVKRNEISEEVGRLLEQALATMRFAPAQSGGRPVASVLDTRLCFDREGVLVSGSPECLQVQPAPDGPAASPAPSPGEAAPPR